ncbi:class I SAM-dependent methyltransferase [Luteimonas salinilitoris]|uniref:Class I SAM-dependent methyltransferase n=1 Tax=Luteimonas salinilitoris TaxID=3237697 RepID=A0ABV4HYV5_9GAMM
MDRDDLPSLDEERRIYSHHENDPSDRRYRAFLDRLAAPLCARLSPGMSGLDYGADPGPTLALMLGERGFLTTSWDPLFEPQDDLLDRRYDFVICTEVVEHFHRPRVEFDRLASLLRPGGWLAIMTQWQPPDLSFQQWHYVRDPTHVSFYAERTFDWIAEKYGFWLESQRGMSP